MVVGPVLVIPAPASTPKVLVVPNGGTTAAACAVPVVSTRPTTATTTMVATAATLNRSRLRLLTNLDFMIGSFSNPSLGRTALVRTTLLAATEPRSPAASEDGPDAAPGCPVHYS
jgi:hypothetical protein